MSLEYEEALKGLSEEEKLYMYYLFKAIATGWRVRVLLDEMRRRSLPFKCRTSRRTSYRCFFVFSGRRREMS